MKRNQNEEFTEEGTNKSIWVGFLVSQMATHTAQLSLILLVLLHVLCTLFFTCFFHREREMECLYFRNESS